MASFSPPASSNEDARREEGEGAGEGFLQPLPATPIPDTTDSSVAPAGRWNLARFWPGGAGGFTTPAHAQPPVASDTGEAESVDGSRRDNAEEEHHAGSDSPQSRANPVSSEAQQPRRQWVIASDMYQVDEELAEAVTLTQEEMEMLLAHRSGLRQTGAKGGETPITGGVMPLKRPPRRQPSRRQHPLCLCVKTTRLPRTEGLRYRASTSRATRRRTSDTQWSARWNI